MVNMNKKLTNNEILEIIRTVEKKEFPEEYKYKQIVQYLEINPFPVITAGLWYYCRNCGTKYVRRDEKDVPIVYVGENYWKPENENEKLEVFTFVGEPIDRFCNDCIKENISLKKEAKFIHDSIVNNKINYTIDQKKKILDYFNWFCHKKCHIYLDHFEPAPCPYECFPLLKKLGNEINETKKEDL